MLLRKKLQLITCLGVFFAIILVFPVDTFAEESIQSVEHESGLYYSIQKGDTLWDLSKRFSDSPWLWPSLWKENNQIPNPHRIYPGERIRLYHQGGIESIIIKSAVEESQEEEPQKEPPYYYYSLIERIGFIKKESVAACGSIFKVKDNKDMISDGDLVYIKQMGNTSLVPGSKYFTYRTIDEIEDEKTGELIGTQYYMTGIIEVTKKGPDFVLAAVVQSFRTIEVNNFLMPYKQRSPKITIVESKPGLNGKIVAAEEQQVISGDNSIAFIDKGSKDGIASGQWYSIYYQKEKRIDSKTRKQVLLPPVVYGTLLVLHAEQTASTVLITGSEKSVELEAQICTPFQ